MAGLAQTTPAWTTLTAYTQGARVTPVTPNGLNWYALVGGTSAVPEPVWPVSDPWTIVDGTVTWQLATSWRQLARDGAITTMRNFKTANPWAIPGEVLTSNPKSYSNMSLPGLYLDTIVESITYARGVRTRVVTIDVVLAVQAPDNDQAGAYTDIVCDALVDAFTAAYHAGDGSSILQLDSVAEVPLSEGQPLYLGNVYTLTATKAEGRI